MLILFDLDDTLVDSRTAYEEGLRALGFSTAHPLFQRARREVKAGLPDLMPAARNRSLYFKRYLELDGGYSPLRHMEMLAKYEETVLRHIKKQWLDLKRDRIFSRLAEKHRLFIITNEVLRTQSLKLQALDPHFHYFSGMITSEEAGVEKPNHEIFRRALEKANGSPESTIMVGDSYEKDITPAVNLGLRAYHSLEFPDPESDKRGPVCLQKLDDIFKVDPTL